MNFEKTKSTYTPPTQGFHIYRFDVEDGPEWTEQNWRRTTTTTYRITQLGVKVYDDGSTHYSAYVSRIKKDGTPYNERPRYVFGVTEKERINAVVEQFRKSEANLQV